MPDPSADRLEHARLVLELDRLERAIIRARGEGAGTSELARERERVREEIRAVVARLEETLNPSEQRLSVRPGCEHMFDQ